jgi:hypothetical protein
MTSSCECARREFANIDEPFRLGVVGMFKAGKSSVINTFLGRRVLREGLVEATAALTELRFAEPDQEKGVIVYTDGSQEELKLDEALLYTDVRSPVFNTLTREAQRTLQERIARIILCVNSTLLRTVTLVDTPGFGGSVVGDKKAFEALDGIDAALMIFPADRVGSYNELEVADFLNRKQREIVALLNRIDDGNGNARAEDELASSEAFLRDHFRSITKSGEGKPIIFRYSAFEILKALETMARDGATPDEQKTASERLVRWGYSGTGDADTEKGVITFIRDRYFSSSNDTKYERKLRGAKQTLISEVEPLVAAVEDAEKHARQSADAARDQHAQQRQRLLNEVEPKITLIENEIRQIVAAQIDPFVRDVEEALLALLHKQEDLDFSDLVKAFRDQDKLVAELQAEFTSNFPKWREEHLLKEIERRINRLLRNQWLFVLDEVKKMDASIVLPDSTELFRQINNAVRGSAVAAGASLTAFVVAIFVPGGALVAVLLGMIGELVGFHFATRHQKRIRDGERTIRLQLRNYAQLLTNEIVDQAMAANDQLAEDARHRIDIEVKGSDEKAKTHSDTAARWHVVRRELSGQLKILRDTEIS